MSFDPNDPNNPVAFPPSSPLYSATPTPYGLDPAAAMATPVKVLGICFIILGVLGALGALFVASLFPLIMAQARVQNPNAAPLPAGFGLFLAVLIGLVGGLLPLIAGFGLLRRASWGRALAIVNAVLVLLSFPFGTALGGFTLYYMLRAGAKEGYDRLSRSSTV